APRTLHLLGLDLATELEELSFGTFPAKLGEQPPSYLEEGTCLFTRLVAKPSDERRDVLGSQRIWDVLGQHGLGHSRSRDGSDRVDEAVLLSTLDRQRVREAIEAELRHRVVRL